MTYFFTSVAASIIAGVCALLASLIAIFRYDTGYKVNMFPFGRLMHRGYSETVVKQEVELCVQDDPRRLYST